jgi:hypothetical protein
LRACVEQRFDGRRIVAAVSMPAIFGAMKCPPQWRALELVIGVFERRMSKQYEFDYFRISVPGGPMKRRGVMLAE